MACLSAESAIDVLLLTLAGEASGSGLAVFQGTRATAPS